MSKKVTIILFSLMSIIIVGLVLFYTLDIFNKTTSVNSADVISIEKADNYRDEKYEIYHMSGTDIESTEVYYDRGTWVMYTDDKLTQVQQYLKAPFDKSMYEIVSAIPAFEENSATYLAYNTDGTLFDVDRHKTFKSVGTEYCFVEWENKGYYYSYTFQKNDVAIYTIFDSAENLFRVYSAEVMAQYEEESNNAAQDVAITDTPDIESNPTTTAVSAETAAISVTEGSDVG